MSNEHINADIKKAIEYFNSLSSEKKAHVAARIKDEKMVPPLWQALPRMIKKVSFLV